MHCSYCGKEINDLNKFILHLDYAHKCTNNYECPFSHCPRSFHRKDSFKRHIILKHQTQINVTKSSTSDGGGLLMDHIDYVNKPSMEQVVSNSLIDSESSSSEDEVNLNLKCQEFQLVLQRSVLNLVSKLYTNSFMPRSLIQCITEYLKSFLNSGFIPILKDIFDFIVKTPHNIVTIIQIVKSLCDKMINSLNDFDTDYKRLQFFKNSGNFIEPIPRIIGFSNDSSKKANEISLVLKERTTIYIPICKTLKLFLELPQVLSKTLEYHNQTYVNNSFINKDCTEPFLKNILDGSLWKEILLKNKGRLTLPLSIYFDDFEICNPLGSHSGVYKLGVIYFTILSLPPEFSSRLENIFPALIFHSVERNQFGNRIVFNELLNSLKMLETKGINVNYEKGSITIYFNVTIITGDNLGIHTIFGLGQSFSSGYCCRFCLSHKTDQESQINLNVEKRLKDAYLDHVETKKYNVQEYCIWNDLDNFHIYENHSVDLMHDLYEGVYRYDMALIIKFLIQKDFFSLQVLNSRVMFCEFDNHEKNKPPPVKKEHLVNECLIFSASEMLCFVRNFRYFVGDFVPENDQIWAFYLSLLEITEILNATEISITKINHLEQLIIQHLKMYLTLFPCRTLKPKHHLLLHYAGTIRKTGPVSKTHCLRYEAKHRELKKYAKNVETRKNIPLTLANRLQIQFACRCFSKVGLEDHIEFGKEIFNSNFQSYNFRHEFDINFFTLNCFEVKWYEKNGLRYNKFNILQCNTSGTLEFGIIKNIILERQNPAHCFIICELMEVVSISEHYRAYLVIPTETSICLDVKDISFRFPTVLRKLNHLKLVSF